MLKNIMIITNRLIITVLSLIIVTVLIFNRTSGSQFGGAEVAPPPVAPTASLPVAPTPPTAPVFKKGLVKPVEWKPEIFKFKIGNSSFAVSPFGGSYGMSPLIYYEDGTVRQLEPRNYAFVDIKNGVNKVYSVFSLKTPKRVSIERLNDNITYFIMFPQDLALKQNLKKLKNPELNRMIDTVSTYTTFGPIGGNGMFGRKPIKIVKTGSSTAILVDNMNDLPKDLYVVKKGETFDPLKIQRVNTSDMEDNGASRAQFLELNMRQIKLKQQYKCTTDAGAQEFLNDLAFYPELSGCPYESLS
jgi:hypothetical protein